MVYLIKSIHSHLLKAKVVDFFEPRSDLSFSNFFQILTFQSGYILRLMAVVARKIWFGGRILRALSLNLLDNCMISKRIYLKFVSYILFCLLPLLDLFLYPIKKSWSIAETALL
jgi:hypothetical protein